MAKSEGYDLVELLDYIDPGTLNYQDWVSVGMALKESGYTAADWDAWSRRDGARYHPGECWRKWDSFQGSASPVTGGTIVQMAKENGWRPVYSWDGNDAELSWDSIIGGKEDGVIVDKTWLERREVMEPNDEEWRPAQDLIRYLETLFEPDENVGYVTESWEKDGKYLPSKGNWDRTAGQLIRELSQCGGDVGSVLGDFREEAGAWIRFNPLDGKGVKNENVTDYRYALVESDTMDLDQQNALIRELELPVACLVYSGGKSVHAIVRIEAATYDEYRKRVEYLYAVLKKNGMAVDTQNKNPSRLSRMPGVTRKGHKQFLMDVNIGKGSWSEWKDWIESQSDDLPEMEELDSVWNNLPDLAPALIGGVLRQGHKMLIAGPSKAGKSFALIELTISIAEGMNWLGWPCAKGRVLYVNLELDRASCLHRFKDVYTALGKKPDNIRNIDIWNLRGRATPMDKLAPKLIRRAAKKNYIAIIIDPIYKIITGDENSADQMAAFCNQFDLLCTELGAAVIYCHHHSKGSQGQKRSMDRASGSGVFARDPDAMLDLIELDVPDSVRKLEADKAECAVFADFISRYVQHWTDYVSQDDRESASRMREAAQRLLAPEIYTNAAATVKAVQEARNSRTAWRIEGTLREFPKFSPKNLWFDYPVHVADSLGALQDVAAEGETPTWQKNFPKRKSNEERKTERKDSIETAYDACKMGGEVTVSTLAEYLGVTEKTVRKRLKEHGDYWIDEGTVGRKQ